MAEQWIVNPKMPKPFPQKLEAIRQAALERWGNASIPHHEIVLWVYQGCPNAAGACLTPETHQPPLSAQGKANPEAYADTFLKRGVFLPTEPQSG